MHEICLRFAWYVRKIFARLSLLGLAKKLPIQWGKNIRCMVPLSTIRYILVQLGTIWYHWLPLVTIGDHWVPFCTIRYHLVSLRTIWYHWVPSATIGSLRYHYVPLGTIRYHRLPFGTILYHWVPSGKVLVRFREFQVCQEANPDWLTDRLSEWRSQALRCLRI